MGVPRHKKGLAIVAGFLFLMGVAVPAAFGLLTEKAMDLGMADLLDKSTNWDSSNIANSTYFVLSGKTQFPDVTYHCLDNNTYRLTPALDDSNDLYLTLATATSDIVSSETSNYEIVDYSYHLNKTALEDVDKIVVVMNVQDAGGHDLTGDRFYVTVLDWSTFSWKYSANVTNGTVRIEIPIDAVKKLQLSSSPKDVISLYVSLYADGADKSLSNVVWGNKVELYDVKKVNASSAANIMLVSSGLLGWVGALAATPYWNPVSNPEHRNVRRVGRAVRRVRRR